MVTPLIQERLVTTPVVTAERRRINESYIIIGTATGGNADTALPVNTPTLFRSAPARAAAATGGEITAGVLAGDWSVVHNDAQTRDITNTLDYYIREGYTHVDEPVIVIRAARTGAAPPTTAQMNAAIDSIAQIATRYPNLHPSAVVAPDLDFARATSNPYGPLTPSSTVGAIPWLARLNSAADNIGAIVVLGGSPSFTRAQAVFWANRNYQSRVVLTFPGVMGDDAQAANARSSAPNFVWSMLEAEENGRGGVSGRGTNLNMMPAEGVNGIVPAISQSYDLESTDDFLLEQAGITVLFNHGGTWRWKRVLFGKDYSTNAPEPRTDSVAVIRYLQHLQVSMRDIGIDALDVGYRGEDFFNSVITRGTALLEADIAAGRVESGRVFKLDPAVQPATTARVGYEVAPFYAFRSVEMEGHVTLPTFGG